MNIPVRCTFILNDKHLSTNIMVLRTFLVNSIQQSCKIFVETDLKNITIGAEHCNIESFFFFADRCNRAEMDITLYE